MNAASSEVGFSVLIWYLIIEKKRTAIAGKQERSQQVRRHGGGCVPTETCAKVPGSSSVIVCFPGRSKQLRAAIEAAERPLQFAEILLRVCVCVSVRGAARPREKSKWFVDESD